MKIITKLEAEERQREREKTKYFSICNEFNAFDEDFMTTYQQKFLMLRYAAIFSRTHSFI